MTILRVAIYTRISQDKKTPDHGGNGQAATRGEGLGVARQEKDSRALAATLAGPGVEEVVVRVYTDNDISAYSGKRRPDFEEMLTDMKAGVFDVLICWHTDRLYRSMKDLERLIEIADAAGIQIRTVNGGDLDLSNSSGRMLARILGSVARQESEHKGERQRAANVQKAASGRWQTANRSYGYTMTGEPLEPEATAIRTAVADVLAGKSIRAVAKEWNDKGLKTTLAGTTQQQHGKVHVVTGTWNGPRVRRVLMNPRYAGLKTHRGVEIGKGDWTPLIDEDTHRGLIAYLSDPTRVVCTSFVRKYIGSGVYICGKCGGPMRGALPGGKGSARTYECKAHQHVVRRGEPLDEYVENLVLGYLSNPETRQRLAAMLHGGKQVDVNALHAQRAALQARLDDLAAMFAAAEIDASQLRRGTNDLRVQLAAVNQLLAETSRRSPVADLLTADGELQDKWNNLSPDLKSKVVQEICTVTVQPAPRGRKFDYNFIDIDWKA